MQKNYLQYSAEENSPCVPSENSPKDVMEETSPTMPTAIV